MPSRTNSSLQLNLHFPALDPEREKLSPVANVLEWEFEELLANAVRLQKHPRSNEEHLINQTPPWRTAGAA